MAIRTDFAAGEVLAAADLNDTFGVKPNYLRQTATPTGAYKVIWEDTNTTPSLLKIWNGSAWVTFSGAGAANFSDAATGTYTDGGISYKYVTKTGSGTLTCTVAGLADVLVVGGGGGGTNGGGNGGGGGGGGHNYVTSMYLPVGTHTITIGAGGAGTANETARSGFASQLLGSVALGGGAGQGPEPNNVGISGASGGGGKGGSDGPGGSSLLSSQGNSGGNGILAGGAKGGGGGGAGAVGGVGAGTTGGAGGAGLANSITGTSVTRAGGGGGVSNTVGAGGAGGGGSSSAGVANTGGGGSANNAGGSGVIIIRVKV